MWHPASTAYTDALPALFSDSVNTDSDLSSVEMLSLKFYQLPDCLSLRSCTPPPPDMVQAQLRPWLWGVETWAGGVVGMALDTDGLGHGHTEGRCFLSLASAVFVVI